MPINSPDVFDSIGDAIVTGGGGGGGVTVTNQFSGKLVVCTATTDELNATGSITFDGTDFIANTNFLASALITSPQGAAFAGLFGIGSRLYKGLTSATIVAGTCYAIQGTTVSQSNATSVGNISVGFLAIATSTNTNTGMVIEGCVHLAGTVGGSNGDPVYIDTAGGRITTTPVSATGNVSRVVGYKISSNQIYFKPSQDWIVIS
jgi:hypothetical protein